MIGCATHTHELTTPTRYMALNLATRRDPTRTTMLRLRFVRQINKRFDALKRDIRVSIVDRDCFAIQPRETIMIMAARPARAFEFQRTEAKIAGFMHWLEEQEQLGILEQIYRPGLRPSVGAAWTDLYVDSAYRQGIRRGGQELRAAGYPVPDWEAVPGGIGAIMAQPIHADRIAVIYARTYEDLKSVTQFTNAQVRRQIADGLTSGLARGLAEGKNPKVIARELYKDIANRVDKIGKVRARMIARTEVIRAHHVASIQEYRRAEVEGVTVDIEWLTGGNPCPICADIASGGPYKLDVIEGMLPAHPNCRCATKPLPRVKGEPAPTAIEPMPVAPPVQAAYTFRDSLPECESWLKGRTANSVKAIAYQQIAGFKAKGMGSRMSKKAALAHFNGINATVDNMMTRHNLTTMPTADVFYITKTNRGRAGWRLLRDDRGNLLNQYMISNSGDWSEATWQGIAAWEKRTGRKWDWVKEESHRATCVRHEYTHLMDFQYRITKTEKFRTLIRTLREEHNFTYQAISDYAGTNHAEWFAEAMSQYTSPLYGKVKTFPAPLEQFLEEVLDNYRRPI